MQLSFLKSKDSWLSCCTKQCTLSANPECSRDIVNLKSVQVLRSIISEQDRIMRQFCGEVISFLNSFLFPTPKDRKQDERHALTIRSSLFDVYKSSVVSTICIDIFACKKFTHITHLCTKRVKSCMCSS